MKRKYKVSHKNSAETLYIWLDEKSVKAAKAGDTDMQNYIAIKIYRRFQNIANSRVGFVDFNKLTITEIQTKNNNKKQDFKIIKPAFKFSPEDQLQHHCSQADCEYCEAEQFEYCPRNLAVYDPE